MTGIVLPFTVRFGSALQLLYIRLGYRVDFVQRLLQGLRDGSGLYLVKTRVLQGLREFEGIEGDSGHGVFPCLNLYGGIEHGVNARRLSMPISSSRGRASAGPFECDPLHVPRKGALRIAYTPTPESPPR